jgi:ribosomal protein L24E
MKMSEICKTCREEFNSGIWVSPQLRDERLLLFCSNKCKERYIKMKLKRIKINYPNYYNKIINSSKDGKDNPFWIKKKAK